MLSGETPKGIHMQICLLKGAKTLLFGYPPENEAQICLVLWVGCQKLTLRASHADKDELPKVCLLVGCWVPEPSPEGTHVQMNPGT